MNRRPRLYERRALPTELLRQVSEHRENSIFSYVSERSRRKLIYYESRRPDLNWRPTPSHETFSPNATRRRARLYLSAKSRPLSVVRASASWRTPRSWLVELLTVIRDSSQRCRCDGQEFTTHHGVALPTELRRRALRHAPPISNPNQLYFKMPMTMTRFKMPIKMLATKTGWALCTKP